MNEKSTESISILYKLIFILLILRNIVSGQIDWAEDDDDPGEYNKNLIIFINYLIWKILIFFVILLMILSYRVKIIELLWRL
jgi:hypothetical protein